MNKIMFATLASTSVLVASSATVCAQAPESGFPTLLVGYKCLTLDNQCFSHDTHPDDSFLPNARVPGSAGTTEVGGWLHFFAVGIRYQARLSERFSLSLDLSGLVGGERDEHQNANDERPAASGAFVYSEARWGLFAAAGAQYHIEGFYVGAETQLGGVFVDSGWDRFGKDESQHTKFELIPSAGPKIGYAFDEDFNVEATAQFGRGVGFGIQAVWKF